MSLTRRDQDRLKVIRTLMERGASYQSASVPAAALGGLLSLGAAVVHYLLQESKTPLENTGFLVLWGVVLGLTLLTTVFLLSLECKTEKRPLLSSATSMVFLNALPMVLMALFFSVILTEDSFKEVICWILFYGLILLSMQHYAPKLLVVLGWVFSLTGLGVMVYFFLSGDDDPSLLAGSELMAATFGGYHLLYAAVCFFSSKKERESKKRKPTPVRKKRKRVNQETDSDSVELFGPESGQK